MQIIVDTSEAQKAGAELRAARPKITQTQVRAATKIVEAAASFIKTEFRSGPTSDRTTQVRSNKLRNSYTSKVDVESNQIVAKVGLIQGSVDGSVLQYGRMQEGYNADGSTFSSKVIRAKGGGWLVFPVYKSNFAGVAKSNIRSWVKTKQVTFRPTPSFPAVEQKFTPQMEAAVGDAAVTVLSEVGR